MSFDTSNRALRLIRTEELRLVNRAWKAVIDSTPLFWAFIPDEPSSDSKVVQGWIKKSGEIPLHIFSKQRFRPPGGFMPLVAPYAHRWRTLELDARGCYISRYIRKPVPLLESFDVTSAFILPDIIVFGGVHPLLSTVRLRGVDLPHDTGFLSNLRELHLTGVSGPFGTLSLSVLPAILTKSPNLNRLVIDSNYINDMPQHSPILLPNLASFDLAYSALSPRCPVTILAMITTPNVTHLQVCFHNAHIPAALDIFTTPAVSRLRQASNLVIRISYSSFHLSTEIQAGALYNPQEVTIGLSGYAERIDVPVRMLRDIDAAIFRLPAVDLTIDHDIHTAGIFDYLKSSRDVGFPLPGLRSVHLTAFLWDTIPYEEMVMNLARTRQDITKVTVRLRKNHGNDGHNFQWDAEHMALVLLE